MLHKGCKVPQLCKILSAKFDSPFCKKASGFSGQMSDKFQALNVCVTAAAAAKISSQEILCWVSETLQTDIVTRVHELGTGEHYCLLLHMLFNFKETIPLKKIKFGSKVEVDHINNWKFFQMGLKSVGLDKEINIDKLVKQKPMDNLEFAQWFYKFFDANRTTDTELYDPVFEREKRGIILERPNQNHFNTSPNKKVLLKLFLYLNIEIKLWRLNIQIYLRSLTTISIITFLFAPFFFL